ncbi:MAG: hypothetical protein RIQ79_1207, partial [Verrucomicrobiota bacterium]
CWCGSMQWTRRAELTRNSICRQPDIITMNPNPVTESSAAATPAPSVPVAAGRAQHLLKIVASVTRISVTVWCLLMLATAVMDMLAKGSIKPLWLPIVLWAASPLLWTARARRREQAGAAGEHPKTTEVWLAGLLLLPAAFVATVLLLLVAMSFGRAPDWEAFYPLLQSSMEGVVPPASTPMLAAAVLSFLIATPLNLVGLAWALGLHRPRWGALALFGLAPVFVYLARDDASSPYSDTWKEFSTMTPEGKAGYDVVMRWRAGGNYAKAFVSPPVLEQLKAKPGSAEWLKAIAENRDRFDAAWTKLEPIRAWWAEWAAMPEIGDHVTGVSSPILWFPPMRVHARMVQVRATQLAQEGRGDEAIEVLLPLIEGAQKLEPSGRSLVRLRIARVLLELGVNAADNVLNLSSVSESSKERLATLLASGSGGELGARRLAGMEFTNYVSQRLSRDASSGPITGGLLGSWLGPVLINPNRTLNQMGAIIDEVQERAARRDSAGIKATLERSRRAVLAEGGIKNIVGQHFVLEETTYYYPTVFDRYWSIEDARAALIARLRGETSPAPEAGATAAATNLNPEHSK